MANLMTSYSFGRSKGLANTFIGGVAPMINTESALATRLGISVSRITLFKVVGSNIECRISGSYQLIQTFSSNDVNQVKYYIDQDGLVFTIGLQAFYTTTLEFGYFPNAISIGDAAFDQNSPTSLPKDNLKRLYIPRVLTIGATVANNNVFRSGNLGGGVIFAHPSLATINAGGVEGDLAYLSTGNTIRYVTNFTAPNSVTNLSAGIIYSHAIQLNFTTPTVSTNAIEYYEVWINGSYTGIEITASGQFALGLTALTSYNIHLVAVDILFNKSISNVLVTATTSPNTSDSDVNAYVSIASLTGFEQDSSYYLISQLKTNNLWNKIQALYPFKGTTASQHKWNVKNLLDTNAAFRLTFFGSGSYSNLGFQPNGTNAYANTNFVPSANQNVNSNGLTVVVGTNNNAQSGDTIEIGSFNSPSQLSLLVFKGNNTTFNRATRLNGTAISQTGNNDARGILTGVRNSSVQNLFRNDVKIATGSADGTLPTVPIFIGALNLNNSPYGYSNQRIQIAIIHEGLTDAEVGILHQIIDISESIAGRKTW